LGNHNPHFFKHYSDLSIQYYGSPFSVSRKYSDIKKATNPARIITTIVSIFTTEKKYLLMEIIMFIILMKILMEKPISYYQIPI
jgi:hypothetical protein